MDITKKLEILKSLSDLSRLQVLNALLEKPAYLEELAVCLNLASSTVSFHLSKLVKAGIVKKRKEQYYSVFEVNRDVLGLTLSDLIRDDGIGDTIRNEREEVLWKKVKSAFFKDGLLVQIPVQRKKRVMILNEFLRMFKPAESYHENIVNDMLKTKCIDYVTVRRMMIDEAMLIRDKQIYKVNENYKAE